MIKFRAWYMPFRKYGAMQEMVYSRASHILALAETEPEKYIPEQFTGLKDVNGKDIYEGDIIASKPNGLTFEPLKIGVVKRSKITAGWSYITATGEYNIWTSGKYRTYEIIRNVHENPELLEE
ncbi:YopX family protein [Lactiplantibacillus plantarum]|uniref:YopX family protein n=1 Tax=Lactiplantibacillus plantarum TaxID=1590 RepID=UPI0021CB740A|nr:YopX family protein [Lactiplantibacillus plantarum]